MDADVKAAERASASGATMVNLKTGPAVFPLAGVVGQEAIKTALLLCAVNPKIGGVVISGSRGTAKSVMARAVHELLPKIEVIKGSAFNIDKESGELDSFLQSKIASGEVDLDALETEVIDAPFVQVSSPHPAGRTGPLLLLDRARNRPPPRSLTTPRHHGRIASGPLLPPTRLPCPRTPSFSPCAASLAVYALARAWAASHSFSHTHARPARPVFPPAS